MHKKISYLIGDSLISELELMNQNSFEIFSEESIEFLSELSNILLKNAVVKKYPDVATFAFFIRKANLNLLKKNYSNNINFRIGRGIVFHITPSNVPVNFAYSLLVGIISGNINIVKVPSKNFEQVNIIIYSIKEALKLSKFKTLFEKRIFVVKYDRDNQATSIFSSICDVRIIWGGDNTINEIRKSSIPSKSTEITFADRYSISVINAKEYLKLENKRKIAIDFYNDTYLFDQNACTSPQSIYWVGSKDEITDAKHFFWSTLETLLVEKNYDLQPIISIDKLTTFYSQAINNNIFKTIQTNNNIWRVNNLNLLSGVEFYKCSSGYFNEFTINSLDELLPIINRKYQTMSYIGFSKFEIYDWVNKFKPIGIDRIVPIGQTMDFSLVWDGFDFVSNLSRQIEIK
jgi:hypothetical protein